MGFNFLQDLNDLTFFFFFIFVFNLMACGETVDDSGGRCWWNMACNQPLTLEWTYPCRLCHAIFPLYCWSFPFPYLQGTFLTTPICTYINYQK